MPEGFKFLWETKIDFFVSLNVPEASKLPNYSTKGSELDKTAEAFKFRKGNFFTYEKDIAYIAYYMVFQFFINLIIIDHIIISVRYKGQRYPQ